MDKKIRQFLLIFSLILLIYLTPFTNVELKEDFQENNQEFKEVIVNKIESTTITYVDTGGNARGLFISEQVVYIADGSSGIAIINITDPLNPTGPSYIPSSWGPDEVVVSNEYAYGHAGGALMSYNITSSSQIAEQGYAFLLSLFIDANYFYATDGGILCIYNSSEPTNLLPMATLNTLTFAIRGLHVENGWAYMAYSNGMVIANVTDSSNLGQPIFFNCMQNSEQVFVAGSYAYILNSTLVSIVNVADPTNPFLVSQYESIGLTDIFVTESCAFLTRGDYGVTVLDIMVRSFPRVLDQIEVNGTIYTGEVSNDMLYLAAGSDGLAAVNVSQYQLQKHDPISIDGNIDFHQQAGTEGWDLEGTRDGSVLKPYVLDRYKIMNSSSQLISISNTNIYFQISNCLLNGIDFLSHSGIYFQNVSHSTIENNIILNCWIGIQIELSKSNILVRNQISDCGLQGINLDRVSFINISKNLVYNITLMCGVEITTCNNITLSNNEFYNSPCGIDLCFNNVNMSIYKNTIFNCSVGITNEDQWHNSTCIIEGNVIFENGYGINGGSNNIIDGNRIFKNGVGIFNIDSNNNLNNNIIFDNSGSGIYIEGGAPPYGFGENNTFTNNEIFSNKGNGLHLDYQLENNLILNNSIYNNLKNGIFVHFGVRNCTVTNNTVYNNSNNGIVMYDGVNGMVSGNIIYNNGKNGFDLAGVNWGDFWWVPENQSIMNNSISGNVENGIRVRWSIDVIVQFNAICNNGNSGINLTEQSDNTTVYANVLSDNSYSGIYTESSIDCDFLNNTIENHSSYGIYFISTTNASSVKWNKFENNNPSGVSQAYDDGYDNTFVNNYWSNWTTLDVNPADGYVDVPYEIDGIADNTDPYPVVFSITDTDGDGMPDTWEEQMKLNSIDPSDAVLDKDLDGLSNLQEYYFGLNATNTDTDSDLMLDGWEVEMGLNANNATDAALDKDEDELTNLQEFQLGLNATDADTDSDLMPDGWEVNSDLNPLINDSDIDLDDDNLSNLQEYQIGTFANNNDTDNDSMPDGWEVQFSLNPLLNDADDDNDNDGYTNLEEFLLGSNPTIEDSDIETSLSTEPSPETDIPMELLLIILGVLFVLGMGTLLVTYPIAQTRKRKPTVQAKEAPKDDILTYFLSVTTPSDLNQIAKEMKISLPKVKAFLHNALLSSQVKGFKYDNIYYPDSYVALITQYISDKRMDILVGETEDKCLRILKELDEYAITIIHFIYEHERLPSQQEMTLELKIPFTVVEDVIHYFNVFTSPIPLNRYTRKQLSQLDVISTLILPFIRMKKLNLVEVVVGLNFPVSKIRELVNFCNTVSGFPEKGFTSYTSLFEPNDLKRKTVRVVQTFLDMKSQFQESIPLLELARQCRMGILSTRIALNYYEENKLSLPYFSDLSEDRVKENKEEITKFIPELLEDSSLSLESILTHPNWKLPIPDLPQLTIEKAIEILDPLIKQHKLNTKDPMVISQFLESTVENIINTFIKPPVEEAITDKIPNIGLMHAQEVLCVLLKLKNMNATLTPPLIVELRPIEYSSVEKGKMLEERLFCNTCQNFFSKAETHQSCSVCHRSICEICYQETNNSVRSLCPTCGGLLWKNSY